MKKARYITEAALVGALYVVLCEFSALLGLSSGAFQIRFAEALTVLPAFLPSAVPGLFVGCLLANILSGAVMWDVIFGSLATLLGAFLTKILSRKNKYLASVPPIVANSVVIPLIIKYAYGVKIGFPLIFLGVLSGEIISCGILGTILISALLPKK